MDIIMSDLTNGRTATNTQSITFLCGLVTVFRRPGAPLGGAPDAFKDLIEKSIGDGVYHTAQALGAWGCLPGHLHKSILVSLGVRVEILGENPPPFLRFTLSAGTDGSGIGAAARRAAERIAECFSHGCLHQYTDRRGLRAAVRVTDIDDAPCFWPVPFDESSVGPSPSSPVSPCACGSPLCAGGCGNFASVGPPVNNPTGSWAPPVQTGSKTDCTHEEGKTTIGGWVICRKCGINMRRPQ